MRLLICLLLLSFFSLDAAQKTRKHKLTSIQIVDRNGFSETINIKEKLEQYEKVNFLQPQPYSQVMRTYDRDDQGNAPSYLTSYYTNGQIKQYLEIVNSRAMGLYQEWYPTGQKKLVAKVIGGQADFNEAVQSTWMFGGCTYAYNEEGKITAKIEYNKGVLDGASEQFFADGTLKVRTVYKNGIPSGELIENYPNGQRLRTAFFEEGLPEGEAAFYWPDGKVAGSESFEKGLLVSGTYYPQQGDPLTVSDGVGKRLTLKEGKLFEISEIYGGAPYGKVWLYTKDGKLESIYHTRYGSKEGEETLFYPNGQKKLVISWMDDMVHGVVKAYYPTGVQLSQKELSKNKKQGLFTAWYKNGDIMLIEEYDNDNIVSGRYFKKGEMSPISTIEKGTGIATLYDQEGMFGTKITYENGIPINR